MIAWCQNYFSAHQKQFSDADRNAMVQLMQVSATTNNNCSLYRHGGDQQTIARATLEHTLPLLKASGSPLFVGKDLPAMVDRLVSHIDAKQNYTVPMWLRCVIASKEEDEEEENNDDTGSERDLFLDSARDILMHCAVERTHVDQVKAHCSPACCCPMCTDVVSSVSAPRIENVMQRTVIRGSLAFPVLTVKKMQRSKQIRAAGQLPKAIEQEWQRTRVPTLSFLAVDCAATAQNSEQQQQQQQKKHQESPGGTFFAVNTSVLGCYAIAYQHRAAECIDRLNERASLVAAADSAATFPYEAYIADFLRIESILIDLLRLVVEAHPFLLFGGTEKTHHALRRFIDQYDINFWLRTYGIKDQVYRDAVAAAAAVGAKKSVPQQQQQAVMLAKKQQQPYQPLDFPSRVLTFEQLQSVQLEAKRSKRAFVDVLTNYMLCMYRVNIWAR